MGRSVDSLPLHGQQLTSRSGRCCRALVGAWICSAWHTQAVPADHRPEPPLTVAAIKLATAEHWSLYDRRESARLSRQVLDDGVSVAPVALRRHAPPFGLSADVV